MVIFAKFFVGTVLRNCSLPACKLEISPSDHRLNRPAGNSGPRQRIWYSDFLRNGPSGDRNPVDARCSAPNQNYPGSIRASYMSFTPEVKQLGVSHKPPPSNEVKERVGLYI